MIAPTDQQGLEQLRNTSIKLAERWQREAVAKVTPAERRFCRFMSRLLANPADKTTRGRLRWARCW